MDNDDLGPFTVNIRLAKDQKLGVSIRANPVGGVTVATIDQALGVLPSADQRVVIGTEILSIGDGKTKMKIQNIEHFLAMKNSIVDNHIHLTGNKDGSALIELDCENPIPGV